MLRRLLRFRLIVLFVVTAVLCGGLAFYVPQRGWMITAQIHVKERPGYVAYVNDYLARASTTSLAAVQITRTLTATSDDVVDARPTSPTVRRFNRDTFRKEFANWVTSDDVLHSAMLDPRLASNSFLLRQENPVDWLREHVVTRYQANSGNFEICLEHRNRWSKSLEVIVDAIATAAVHEAFYRDYMERTASRIALESYSQAVRDEIEAIDSRQSILAPTAKARFLADHKAHLQYLWQEDAAATRRIERFDASQPKPIEVKRVGPTLVEWTW
jgi:hypothetical protein